MCARPDPVGRAGTCPQRTPLCISSRAARSRATAIAHATSTTAPRPASVGRTPNTAIDHPNTRAEHRAQWILDANHRPRRANAQRVGRSERHSESASSVRGESPGGRQGLPVGIGRGSGCRSGRRVVLCMKGFMLQNHGASSAPNGGHGLLIEVMADAQVFDGQSGFHRSSPWVHCTRRADRPSVARGRAQVQMPARPPDQALRTLPSQRGRGHPGVERRDPLGAPCGTPDSPHRAGNLPATIIPTPLIPAATHTVEA